MTGADKSIRKAAAELAAALTEGGQEYSVDVRGIDVTRVDSVNPEFAYTVTVVEIANRQIAP